MNAVLQLWAKDQESVDATVLAALIEAWPEGLAIVESGCVLRGNRALNAALSAITAAVVGVILNLALWFALHTWFAELRPLHAFGLSFDAPVIASFQPWAVALSLAAMIAIFRFKAGMLQTLAGCSLAGVVLYFVGAIATA